MRGLPIRRIALAFAASLACLMANPVHAADIEIQSEADKSATVERQILVMLRMAPPHFRQDGAYGGSYGDGAANVARRRLAKQIARRNGLKILDGWPMPLIGVDCYVMEAAAGAGLNAIIERISKDRSVAWSQPMHTYQLRSASLAAPLGDPMLPVQPTATQWNLPRLQKASTGRGVRVAVIDSKVDVRHPDLEGQFVADENFVGRAAIRSERHGTAVAGIIGARAGNGIGIAGVAPGVRLMALRACWEVRQRSTDDTTVCNSLSLARALQFALENGADVLNLSLSGPRDPLLASLVNLAIKRKVTVIAAFDPDRANGGFPALLDGVIAVIDDSVPRIPAGVYGAPGRGIPTTQPGGGWHLVNGTSFAVAQVSGLAALVGERGNRRAPFALVRAPGGRIKACATLLRTAPDCDCDCEL